MKSLCIDFSIKKKVRGIGPNIGFGAKIMDLPKKAKITLLLAKKYSVQVYIEF